MNKILLLFFISCPSCLCARALSQLDILAATAVQTGASDLNSLKNSASKIDGAGPAQPSRTEFAAERYSSSPLSAPGTSARSVSVLSVPALSEKAASASAEADNGRNDWLIPAANAAGVAAAAVLTAVLGGAGLLLGLAVWAGLAYFAARKTGIAPKFDLGD